MKKTTNSNIEQDLEIKKTKFFWLYFIVGVCLAGLGVFLLPVWENTNVFWNKWASEGISLMLFVILVIYVCYLIGCIKKDNPKVKKLLRVCEIMALIVVAVLCLLQQFDVLNIIGPCFVVGAVIWLRGIVCALTAYIFNVKKKDRTVDIMLLSLAAVTLGTVFMVRRFTAPIFIWVISIGLILLALAAIAFGFLSIPKKQKEE